MARRRHSRIPTAAKVASGVAVAGVFLGMLLALAVDPVMKNPAEPSWAISGRAQSAADVPNADWFGEAPVQRQATEGFRPDLDYDEVIGAEWALPDAEAGIDLEPLPPPEEAVQAADEAARAAAAAQEAAVDRLSEAETGSQARKSQLVQSGLY